MSSASESDQSNHESEPEENETDEIERLNIREKLGSMSFEELLKMKEDMGSKLYNKMLSGDNKTKNPIKIKRANKNRPQEISSKIKPKLLYKTLSAPKVKKKIIQQRDPRFDSLCGDFNKDKFQNDYRFVNDIQEKEKQLLEKEEKLEQDADRKKKLKSAIQRLKNKSLERKKSDERKLKKVLGKIEIKEKLKKGELPFKTNKSDEKAESLINQFEELKKSNKLEKYLIKKSKKNNIKEAKMNSKTIFQ